MRYLGMLLLRLRSLFSRSRLEQELDEELRYHLDREIEANIARGMNRAAARRAALRDFAGFDQRKEECRDARGLNLIDDLRQDLRIALRQLRRTPAFTITALLVLGLGMCGSISIFAFVDAALLKPLPYQDAARLVAVSETVPSCADCKKRDLSYPDFVDVRKANTVFRGFALYTFNGAILTTPGGARAASRALVTSEFFGTLGVTPILGQDFEKSDALPAQGRSVILTNATWKKDFGGKADVIGQSAILDGVPYTIIGVLGPDFHFAPAGSVDFWTEIDASESCAQRRMCHRFDGIARLRDGVSIAAAQANVTSIAEQLEVQYPDSNRDRGVGVKSLAKVIVGDIRPMLLVLLVGAGLLLLIACINVTSLLLVRSENRRREMAIRAALGASRGRLIRQVGTEGLLLVLAGGAGALLLAQWTMRLLAGLIPSEMAASLPFLEGLGLNSHTLAFAGGVLILAAVMFAITPSFRGSLGEIRQDLAEEGRTSAGAAWRRLGPKLVVIELATAIVLLAGAGLLGKSLYRLLHVELGFQPDHVATLTLAAPDLRYAKDEEEIQLAQRIVDNVSGLPGVRSVALASQLPVRNNGNTNWIRIPGQPYNGEHNEVNARIVSSQYFTTLGARLLAGRYFTETDDTSRPRVAIINQTLARKHFQGIDPIGKQIGDSQLNPDSLVQVVGVVEDVRDGSLDEPIWPAEYIPINQNPRTEMTLIVRTSQPEESMLTQLNAAIQGIDPDIATTAGGSMREKIADSPAAYLHRSAAWLVGGFAAAALLLAVVGLYGVIAYSAGQRTREIGIRIALGATGAGIYRLVISEAAWLIASGIGLGMITALAATRLMRNLLFGVQSWDIPTLVSVALVLAAAALAASFVPARRAASINPTEALRSE